MQLPNARQLLGTTAAAVVLVASASPLHAAAKSDLKDPSGVLTISAEGRWREQKTEHAIAATGFLGVKRAELFAVVYADEKAAAGAAKRWKTWRTESGGSPTFTHSEQNALRFTAHSSSAGTVDYVRALDGDGQSAVVWVRVNGDPGVAADAASALLDGAKVGTPKKETPAAGETGEKATGAEGADPETADPKRTQRDPDFRVEIVLPLDFRLRKDIKSDGRRVLSAIGKLGSDPEAFFDLYLFDEYLRADAAGRWWMERERVGWPEGVQVVGDHSAFKVEPKDETWTRHVRVVHTEAGIVGFKIDAESQADKAALAALDAAVGSLKVLKARQPVPAAPPGMKTMESEHAVLQYQLAENADAPGADTYLREADVVDLHVKELLSGLDPRDDRKAILRVYPTAEALAAALRPLGITDGRHAYWWLRDGVVLTHSGAIEETGGKAELRSELTRSAIQRRLGYRAPFWLEAGAAKLVASSAFNKGRIDQLHPEIVTLVRDVAPNGMEHEAVRWWTREGSADHPERDAVSWSFLYFFLYGGQSGMKWKSSFDEYVKLLASTGDPTAAGKAFDFSRNVELAEDWKKWARRL